MKAFLGAFCLIALVGCETGPTEEELLANKPTIFSMGVDFSLLIDPADFVLISPYEYRLFNEFGLPVENGENGLKYLAHPEFYMNAGAPVMAVSNGVVTTVAEIEGQTDMIIMVRPDDAELWTIGYEHVSNVQVAEGDRVTLGDHIADFSPQSHGGGWTNAAKTSLMIFHDNGERDRPNFTICPFDILDSTVRDSIVTTVQDHIDEWETYHNRNEWDQDAWQSFGCYITTAGG